MLIKSFPKCVPTEFHASSEAIVRQLPEKRLQSEIYMKIWKQYILGVAHGVSGGMLQLIRRWHLKIF